MSLTELLAILGGLVLAGVVAHGAWAARKAGPRRASPPVEPSLQPGGSAERKEPNLGEAQAAVAEPFEPAAEAAISPLALAETVPAIVRQPPRKASARIDALIDAIATISLEAPISGEMALSHLPGSRRAGTKPFHIEGLNSLSGDWELPAPGQRYGEFQAGLQMANRSGALNEIEYSEFVQKLQGFVDGIGGFVQFPDMLDVVARARELDQFAGEHDAQLAIQLKSRGAAWTLGYVQQIALRHGFVPGAVPGRLVLPAAEEGLPPVLSLSFESQAALAEDPQASSLHELTLALDVPQTAESAEPFAAWQESARALSRDIEADLCDDRGHQLNLHSFAAISEGLAELYKALAARDLAAGSLAARRLFS
ncbi:cell division protein FtsZ [Roseateles sp. DAIF2]|uniref:cell division protein FtsZ n=1 Tax=Roseateles sp. DAIF2 TaxID=2714952 RepID=UPI0018A3027D|nr:cell division protein FtsZ [Roseateles sp. DAIF2]QPF73809.1 cell division protein FtsZ [Roseateles sp. DAIF2]